MKGLAAGARFVAASGLAFAACFAWPPLVLAAPAWIAWALANATGAADLGTPAFDGAAIAFARTPAPLVLEDPYVLAGIPLYLGLWAIATRAPRAVPWGRIVAGLAALEGFAGIVLALVATSVDRGWIASPAREPLELVALTAVAAIRILPLPLWLVLEPARGALLALPAGPRSRPRPRR